MPMKVPGRCGALLLLALSFTQISDSLAQVNVSRIQKKALLNGFEVYFLPPRNREVSQFVFMIKNGAAFDPTDKWGVTNLMLRMLLNGGTRARSSEQIKQDLEARGAQVRYRVEWDALFISGEVPSAQLQDTLSILAELIVHPDLTEEHLERERTRMLKDLQIPEDPNSRAQSVFRGQLFVPNPYGRPIEGTIVSVATLTLVDVKIQYRKLIMPNQSQLALHYDDFDGRLFLSLGRPWGGWVRSDPAPFTFRKAQPGTARRIVLVNLGASESVIRLGGLAVSKSDRYYYPFKVLEHYLTLSLPDWAKEIEDSNQIRGSARLSALHMPGDFQITLQVAHSHVGDYLRRCLSTLDRLADGEINPERYQEAKKLSFLDLKRKLDEPTGQLFELLRANLNGLGVSHLVNFGLRLDRVQQRQIPDVLTTYLRGDSLLIVVAGPASEIGKSLSQFGTVQILN